MALYPDSLEGVVTVLNYMVFLLSFNSFFIVGSITLLYLIKNCLWIIILLVQTLQCFFLKMYNFLVIQNCIYYVMFSCN